MDRELETNLRFVKRDRADAKLGGFSSNELRVFAESERKEWARVGLFIPQPLEPS